MTPANVASKSIDTVPKSWADDSSSSTFINICGNKGTALFFITVKIQSIVSILNWFHITKKNEEEQPKYFLLKRLFWLQAGQPAVTPEHFRLCHLSSAPGHMPTFLCFPCQKPSQMLWMTREAPWAPLPKSQHLLCSLASWCPSPWKGDVL